MKVLLAFVLIALAADYLDRSDCELGAVACPQK